MFIVCDSYLIHSMELVIAEREFRNKIQSSLNNTNVSGRKFIGILSIESYAKHNLNVERAFCEDNFPRMKIINNLSLLGSSITSAV